MKNKFQQVFNMTKTEISIISTEKSGTLLSFNFLSMTLLLCDSIDGHVGGSLKLIV